MMCSETRRKYWKTNECNKKYCNISEMRGDIGKRPKQFEHIWNNIKYHDVFKQFHDMFITHRDMLRTCNDRFVFVHVLLYFLIAAQFSTDF